MVKTKTIIPIIVILIFAIAGPVVWYVTHSGQEHVEIVGKLALGFVGGESAAALYIADELHLFAGSGINVTLRPFGTGLASYEAMLKARSMFPVRPST